MKIIKNDTVKIMSGKDAGKTGKVERVFEKETKVLVEGINEFKRHMKARSQSQPAEIITINKPLALSSVQLVCPKCKKPTRVGYKIDKGEKMRMCLKCKGVIS